MPEIPELIRFHIAQSSLYLFDHEHVLVLSVDAKQKAQILLNSVFFYYAILVEFLEKDLSFNYFYLLRFRGSFDWKFFCAVSQKGFDILFILGQKL